MNNRESGFALTVRLDSFTRLSAWLTLPKPGTRISKPLAGLAYVSQRVTHLSQSKTATTQLFNNIHHILVETVRSYPL